MKMKSRNRSFLLRRNEPKHSWFPLILLSVSQDGAARGDGRLLPLPGPRPLHQGQQRQVRAAHGHRPLRLLRHGVPAGRLQDDRGREARRHRRGQGEGGGGGAGGGAGAHAGGGGGGGRAGPGPALPRRPRTGQG